MVRHFDPNATASENSGVFGLPYTEAEAELVLIPVPWEATTSYGGGTSDGPRAIFEASKQVDLFDLEILKPYEAGIYMCDELNEIRDWNARAKTEAQKIIAAAGVTDDKPALIAALKTVNEYGEKLNHSVYVQTKKLLSAGKLVGVIGGDHSTPFGALQAISEKYKSFGILHFDAHSDTRQAYQGFTWSHASIMYNVLEKLNGVIKLVQVGIRDICEQEVEYTATLKNRVKVFYDQDLALRKLEGAHWDKITKDIISTLPHEVWVSFDIDGLDPRFCPHTGTPVPGGLDYHEALYLISAVVKSGRKIIGFDINEVAPNPRSSETGDEWDANVGARLLYKLCAWTLASQSKAKQR
ncbi:MAG: agmatinase family protein [Bdellovibrionota bacterium]